MASPLTHYYIATSPHLVYPSSQAEVSTLRALYPGIAKMYPSFMQNSPEKAVLLAKYRHLLFTGTRCLQVRLVLWRGEQQPKECPFSIPIFNGKEGSYTYLSLEDFLSEIYWSAFKKSPYPVVLQLFTEIGDQEASIGGDKVDQLYGMISSKLQCKSSLFFSFLFELVVAVEIRKEVHEPKNSCIHFNCHHS